jgi:uncharacterized protein (UPF0335 family)
MSSLQASAQKQLRQFIEQIERLEEDKKGIQDDIKDKFAEAKAVGFDVKAMRQIIRLRKKSKTERQEEEGILEVYMHALGMLDDAVAMPGAAGALRSVENDDDRDEPLVAAE